MKGIKKIGIISSALMIISSVGYYSIGSIDDKFIYVWIFIFIASLLMLSFTDYRLFKQNGTKLVYLDVLFLLWVILVPRIYLPYGISRLIMASIGMIYAVIIGRRKFDSIQ